MFFVLQKEKKDLDDIDLITLKLQLDSTRLSNEYTYMNLEEISSAHFNGEDIAIPVGSIPFVEGFLKNIKNIPQINPIEIPEILRTNEFLLRKYQILEKKELFSLHGYYFVKYASRLKELSHLGDIDQLKYVDDFSDGPFLKDGLYVVSQVKDILAEYRVFVINDKIEAIQFYDGYPTVMPSPIEIKKLEKMVGIYSMDIYRPKAYTMDIAITKENNESGRDLMILEVHSFSSVGLYGYDSKKLPMAYKLGFDYYLQNNKPIKRFV